MLLRSIAISFFLFMPLWAHIITFRSLQRNIPARSERPRYNLADIMILVGLISVGTALGSHSKIGRDTENWILIISLNLLLVLMWHKCNQLMRKNGITENKSRVAMQIFTFPSSILALSFLLASGLSVLASFASDYKDPESRELPNHLFCLAVAVGWIYLTRRSFSLMLDRNPTSNAE
ncbi:MAG: hypothetical protein AAGA30_15320 [Planctomycetota bacterium]